MVKKRILVVDDEEGFSNMLKLNLETLGNYDVMIENDSQKAIQAALNYKPHLVLLDVIMPNLEGPDVAFAMKQKEELVNTPIVFLTATVTRNEVESQGGKIGGHPFVAKPSSLNILMYTIERNISLIP